MIVADQVGQLTGVGTGPGDPDLLTVKAVRAIEQADVLAYFAKRGGKGNARSIVERHVRPGTVEVPLEYPVTTEIDKDHADYKAQILAFYEGSAEAIAEHLNAGRNVVVLSEGDPLFYGSYMHLHVRLANHFPTEVIAGVTAMSGSWSQVGVPLVQGDEVLTVLPGTMNEAELIRRLADTDAAVIMKVGRNLPKIKRALNATGKLKGAVYVERATMANTISSRLAAKTDDEAPYFAIVLVPGWADRPEAVK